jgi:hypothetical protein
MANSQKIRVALLEAAADTFRIVTEHLTAVDHLSQGINLFLPNF